MLRGSFAAGVVVVLGLVIGGFPGGVGGGGGPGEVLAAQGIALLRLKPSGEVIEINPSTHLSFRDLDGYLERRLSGKSVLEIKVQERVEECDQIILIRYE